MRNVRRKRVRGFTLTETLIVVAIIIILAGVAIVAVPAYLRGLRQTELDADAKELFIAAQNHLTMADSQGFLGVTGDGFGTKENGDDGIYWFLVGDDRTELDNRDSLLSQMLPQQSIDDYVRKGGSYIIRYQKAPAQVLDVFYSEAGGRFPHTFVSAEYTSLMDGYREEEHKADRRKYGTDRSVIGYYGGVEASESIAESVITAPSLQVVNGDRLLVTVKDTNAGRDSESGQEISLKLIITGVSSGNVREIELDSVSGAANVTYDVTNEQYLIVLDDITTNGLHFADLFASEYGGNNLIPGEDLRIRAVAFSSGTYISTAKSAEQTVNSLFERFDGETGRAKINSFRHLENLDRTISSLATSLTLTGADQLTNLTWGSEGTVFDRNVRVYDASGISSEEGTFLPVNPDAAIDYNGQDCRITGLTVLSSGNAGLFGALPSGSAVRDLKLIDPDVESTGGNAGALTGMAVGSQFSGILVRNEKSSTESELEITAAGNAGGLAGSVSGCQVNLCAAAVYVSSSEGDAGGLIGRAGGQVSVTNSYSGGHTVHARFQNDPAATNGRVNVVGGTNAGGLIGNASDAGLTVTCCYSTCSAKTADGTGRVGGLIGAASSGTVTGSYAAGMLVATAENPSHPLVGNAGLEGCGLSFSGNYTLNGLSENSRDVVIEGITGVNGQDTSVTAFILPNEEKTTAYTYDDTLIVEYLNQYSFPVIEQLNGGSGEQNVKAGISDIHYGDWQIPTLVSLNFVINNADRLSIRIERDEDVNLITFSVTGQKSEITKVFLLSLSENEVSLVKQGIVDDKVIVWDPAVSTEFALSADSQFVTVTLDDITTAGSHFGELFPDMIPGENIAVHVGSGESSWKELQQTQMAVDNSLFARSDRTIGKANISYVRHLQNLDPNVSGVSSQVTESKLLGNLNWDGTVYGTIYNSDSTKTVSGTFYGIQNNALLEFDGNGHTLQGFVIRGATDAFVADGTGNAGLFRKVTNGMRIANVKLSECSVESASQNAGTLVAEIGGNGATIDSALAISVNNSVTAGGNGNAGGLIGKIGANAGKSVTIGNSAASVRVHAENGTAGGLVGLQSGGSVVISKSYAGGHTNGFAKYQVDSAQDYNIRSDSGIAGGLLGGAQGGTLAVTRSFSTSSVSAADTMPAGGLIGQVAAGTSLNTVYAIGPVRNVRTSNEDALTAAGAFIGQITNGITVNNVETYYLPEVYPDTSTYVSGSGLVSSVAYLGSSEGHLSGPVELAYYEKDGAGNLISAKTHTDTMQIKTYPFDAWLRVGYGENGGNREYPFSIWTNFSFDNSPRPDSGSNLFYGVYYGDWQPVLHAATVVHYVTFRYLDPVTGTYCGLSSDALGYQEIHEGEANSLILPFVAPISGYELTGWYAETESGSVLLSMRNGLVVIPESLCSSDLTVTAKFTKLDNERTVTFFYDPTGANTVFEQIGSPVKVEKNAPLNSVEFPSRNIENCSFIGWFADPAFQTAVDPSADTPIGNDLVFYAKYRPINLLTVTIDFLYQVDGGSSDHLNSVPTYRIEDQGQYKIQFEEGTVFHDLVPLPVIANYSGSDITVGYYEDDGEGTPELVEHNDLLNAAKTALNVETSEARHYVVIYHVTTGSGEIETYSYQILYRMHDTSPNTTQAQLAFQAGGTYSYARYGNSIFSAPIGTIPDIKFESIDGFVRTTGSTDIRLERKAGSVTDYVIYVDYVRRQYTLDFDSKSGSYVDPVLLSYGQPLSDGKPADPTRTGYTFNSWILHDKGAADGTSTYAWSGTGSNTKMPAKNVRAEAKWNAGAASYTVIFWRQKASDDKSLNTGNLHGQKSYDFAGIETRSGTTGTTPALKSADTSKAGSGDYIGFKYLRNDAADQTIRGDGTTVVNVYYDRNLITMNFTVDGSPLVVESRTVSTDADADQGLINGEYVELHRNAVDGKWYYTETYEVDLPAVEQRYTGTTYYEVPDPSWTSSYYGYISDSGYYHGFTTVTYRVIGWFYGVASSYSGTFYKQGDNGAGAVYAGEVDGQLVSLTRRVSRVFQPFSGTVYREKNSSDRSDGFYLDSNTMKPAYYRNGKWYKKNNYTSQINGTIYFQDSTNNGSAHYGLSGKNLIELSWDADAGAWGTYTETVYYTYIADGKETRTREVEYTGDRYKTHTQRSPFTGLYGQPLSMYGYSWPSTYVWTYRKGTSSMTMTFLGSFMLPDQGDTSISFTSGDRKQSTIRFYLQNADDSWPADDDPSDTGGTSTSGGGNTFNFTEKYDGYYVVQYQDSGSGGWKTAQNGSSAYVNIGSLQVRYARRSYTLSFYNTTNGATFGSRTVKYGGVMTPATVANPSQSEQAAGYRWDGKYYEDQACTVEFDFSKPMPSHSVIVYVRYVLPSYDVTFYADETATSQSRLYSFTVTQGNSLDPLMADSYGNLLNEYKPERSGYVFDGWYYLDGNTERPFILSLGIRSDMTVYAKWTMEGEEEVSTEKRDVTIQYLFKETGGGVTVLREEAKRYDLTVGTTLALQAPDIEGYYAERMIWYHQVSENEDPAANTVVFYYQKIKPWKYTVEYYARYSSFEAAGTEISEYSIMPQGQTKDYLIAREEDQLAYNQYESITFTLPAGFERYHLHSYEYDGRTGTATALTIHPDGNQTATVRFYLEPDSTKLSVGDRYVTYNGESQALLSEICTGANAAVVFPDTVTGLEKHIYRYYDGDGHVLAADDVVNAGTYRMNAYVVITVTGKAVGDTAQTTRSFLLWKDTDNGLSLRIGRRLITVESESATAKYSAGSILTRPNVTVTYTGTPDGNGAFVGDEGADFIFAVDAFRMDPGSSTNTFTIMLWDGSVAGKAQTLATNYQITIKYGTLTVTE